MRLNRIPRRGTIMLIAYGLMSLYYLLLIVHPRNAQRTTRGVDYYSQSAAMLVSQCGPGGCSTGSCSSGNCSLSSSSSDGEIWQTYSDGWVYRVSGVEHGRIYRDGRTTGFVAAQPTWYPGGMPQAFQRVGQIGQRPTGDLPPSSSNPIGQSGQLPPTGVNPDKVAEDKAKVPGGVTINGHPASESLASAALSDSAKAQGLKDYDNVLRLVVCGKDAERGSFVSIAKPWADASQGRFIIQEFDPTKPEDWQARPHSNGLKMLPEYHDGQPFAYLQNGDKKNNVKAIMFTPTEVGKAMKQVRPEMPPNFDAARARAITDASNDWMIWVSGSFIAVMGLIGAVTSKSQA